MMIAAQRLVTLGAKLSILAKLSGITQEELAKRCLTSRITVNRFFKGRTEIRSSDLVEMLNLFGIDVLGLLEEQIERLSRGKAPKPSSHVSEIVRLLDDLDPQVQRTVIEQIKWWARNQSAASTHSSALQQNMNSVG